MQRPGNVSDRAERVRQEQAIRLKRIIAENGNDQPAHDKRGYNGDQRREDLSENLLNLIGLIDKKRSFTMNLR